MNRIGLKSFGKNFLCGCQDFAFAKLVRLKVEFDRTQNILSILGKEELGHNGQYV